MHFGVVCQIPEQAFEQSRIHTDHLWKAWVDVHLFQNPLAMLWVSYTAGYLEPLPTTNAALDVSLDRKGLWFTYIDPCKQHGCQMKFAVFGIRHLLLLVVE